MRFKHLALMTFGSALLLASCSKEELITKEDTSTALSPQQRIFLPTGPLPIESTVGVQIENFGTSIWKLDPTTGKAISPAVYPSFNRGGNIQHWKYVNSIAIDAEELVYVIGGETGPKSLLVGTINHAPSALGDILQTVLTTSTNNVIFEPIATFGTKMTDVEVRTYTSDEILSTHNPNAPNPLVPAIYKEVFTITENNEITGLLLKPGEYAEFQQSVLFDLNTLYTATQARGPFKLAIKGNEMYVWDAINEDVLRFTISSDGQNNPTLYRNSAYDRSINSIICNNQISIQRTGFCIAGALDPSGKNYQSFDHLIHLKLNQCPGTETWNEVNNNYTGYNFLDNSDKELSDLSATNYQILY